MILNESLQNIIGTVSETWVVSEDYMREMLTSWFLWLYCGYIEFLLPGNTKVPKGVMAPWQQLTLKVEHFYLYCIYHLSVSLKLFQIFSLKSRMQRTNPQILTDKGIHDIYNSKKT